MASGQSWSQGLARGVHEGKEKKSQRKNTGPPKPRTFTLGSGGMHRCRLGCEDDNQGRSVDFKEGLG